MESRKEWVCEMRRWISRSLRRGLALQGKDILIVSDNELSIQVAYPVRSATFFINITSMFINKGGTTVIRP